MNRYHVLKFVADSGEACHAIVSDSVNADLVIWKRRNGWISGVVYIDARWEEVHPVKGRVSLRAIDGVSPAPDDHAAPCVEVLEADVTIKGEEMRLVFVAGGVGYVKKDTNG